MLAVAQISKNYYIIVVAKYSNVNQLYVGPHKWMASNQGYRVHRELYFGRCERDVLAGTGNKNRYKKVRNKIAFIWRFIHERRIKTCIRIQLWKMREEWKKHMKKRNAERKRTYSCDLVLEYWTSMIYTFENFVTKENDISSRYRINQIESSKFVDQNSVHCCSDSAACLKYWKRFLRNLFRTGKQKNIRIALREMCVPIFNMLFIEKVTIQFYAA